MNLYIMDPNDLYFNSFDRRGYKKYLEKKNYRIVESIPFSDMSFTGFALETYTDPEIRDFVDSLTQQHCKQGEANASLLWKQYCKSLETKEKQMTKKTITYHYGLCNMNASKVYVAFKKTKATSKNGALRVARRAAKEFAPCKIHIYDQKGDLLVEKEQLSIPQIIEETMKRR